MRGPASPTAIGDGHRRDRDTYVLGVVSSTEDTVLGRVDTYGQRIWWSHR